MTNECKADIVREEFMSCHGNVVKSQKFDPQIIEQSENWIRDEGGGGETLHFQMENAQKRWYQFLRCYGNNLPPSALKDRPELLVLRLSGYGSIRCFSPYQSECSDSTR